MTDATDNIRKVAKLAHLALSDQEISDRANDFQKTLAMIEKMSECDTTSVLPMAHPHDATQPTREDAIAYGDERDALQAIAPATLAGLYTVPQFIETD